MLMLFSWTKLLGYSP